MNGLSVLAVFGRLNSGPYILFLCVLLLSDATWSRCLRSFTNQGQPEFNAAGDHVHVSLILFLWSTQELFYFQTPTFDMALFIIFFYIYRCNI